MDIGTPNIIASNNTNLTADELEMYKYAFGVIVLLMISVYYISNTNTRAERLNAFMWSSALIGGTISGVVASNIIPPKYPEILSITPGGYDILDQKVSASLIG